MFNNWRRNNSSRNSIDRRQANETHTVTDKKGVAEDGDKTLNMTTKEFTQWRKKKEKKKKIVLQQLKDKQGQNMKITSFF